ncbi:hypothetical protein Tco_0751959 [Tanacetum coccineum]|uniref:Uncharacterized protein n=1 Tax=Tanacetum coccineum TaxID=301880 RepID=A0ABQ4Z966_9ASTR
MTAILKQFQATPPPSLSKILDEFVLLAVVLIHIISVSPPMATLSRNIGIISKDTLQQPRKKSEGPAVLRTARALIDVHGEEMILRDGNERLILNMRHDTSSYSTQPHQESISIIDVYNVSHEEILEDLFATNHPSGNPTSSLTSHTDLTSSEEEFEAYLASDSFPLGNSDPSSPPSPYHNSLSGSTTSSSPSLSISETSDYSLEEFAEI